MNDVIDGSDDGCAIDGEGQRSERPTGIDPPSSPTPSPCSTSIPSHHA